MAGYYPNNSSYQPQGYPQQGYSQPYAPQPPRVEYPSYDPSPHVLDYQKQQQQPTVIYVPAPPSPITTGAKWLYGFLGFLVPFITMIVLMMGTSEKEGQRRARMGAASIGLIVRIVIMIISFMVSGAAGLH